MYTRSLCRSLLVTLALSLPRFGQTATTTVTTTPNANNKCDATARRVTNAATHPKMANEAN